MRNGKIETSKARRSRFLFPASHFPFSISGLALGIGCILTLCGRPCPADPAFSRLDSLFLAAATGEPRFQALRDASERALLADTGLLNYLVERRLSGQTPRQQQYVERLFTLRSDSGRRAEAREALARAIASPVTDTVRAQLLYIGSRIGDSAFRATALPWLTARFEPTRRMAIRSLGSYPDKALLPLLWRRLRAARGLERQQCLWALEAQGPLRDWKALPPLLSDDASYNRREVRNLLLKATDSSWTKLGAAMPQSPDARRRREWWLLALDAKGGREFLKTESGMMSGDERKLFGVAGD